MKSFIAIAFVATLLAVRAEEVSTPPITPGSTDLSGGLTTLPDPVLPPLNTPLIRSGHYGTIRYVNGPAFSWPFASSASLDLNGDGISDFQFIGESMITASIPGNVVTWLGLLGLNGIEVLTTSNSVAVLPFGSAISPVGFTGAPIGPVGSTGPSWRAISNAMNLTVISSNTEGWSGRLGRLGIGFIGVRFQADDEVHYGWIRVRLPTASTGLLGSGLSPVVLDWAYEKRPDKPINAGAVSSARGVKEFGISFRDPDGERVASYGNSFLIGNILRYEIRLAGTFSNATLFADSAGVQPWQRRLAFARLDSPRIDVDPPCVDVFTNCPGDLTVFFGDIKLSGLQAELLRRGKLRIDVGNGAVTGRFEKDLIMIPIEAERQQPGGPGLPPIELPPTIITIEEQMILIELERERARGNTEIIILPPYNPENP